MTRPVPPPAFRWTDEPWGAALRCDPLSAHAQHLFTTRQLGLRGGVDQPDKWEAIARSLDRPGAPVARVRQVHGGAVRLEKWGRPFSGERPEADAIVSDRGDVVLAVQVADCVPLLVADARTGAVAAIHAGWRGTCARVTPAALEVLARECGSRASDLVVAIGPSIGPCCYEVGPELVVAFEDAGHDAGDIARWFTRVDMEGPTGGSLRLDVARANVGQLIAAGVPADRIHACGFCTKCHPDVFDSYRAAGAAAGRMAASIAGAGRE